MQTLVIPDIHNNFHIAEDIIAKEKHDNIVFLGDYFDSYDDIEFPQKTKNTAVWLKESLTHKNRIHLIGNHDLSYLSRGYIQCAGYSPFKNWEIRKILDNADFDKLVFHTWVDNWLCTHAGLSDQFYMFHSADLYAGGIPVKEFLIREEKTAREKIKEGKDHIFWDCSEYRGGWNDYGGIVWCDFDEFTPIPNINQIFGHTAFEKVRQKIGYNSINYCIDTFGKYYCIIEDGNVFMRKTRIE